MTERRCEICDRSLKGMRSDAEVCGRACRAERWRRRQQPQRTHSAFGHCRCGQHVQVRAHPDGTLALPLCCPRCGADAPVSLVLQALAAVQRQSRSYTVHKGALAL